MNNKLPGVREGSEMSRYLLSARRATQVIVLTALIGVTAADWAQAGQNEWTSNGPFGGPVVAVLIDPQTPTTLYAAVATLGNFKSVDGGGRWTRMNSLGIGPDVLAIDPQTPTTLYAGGAFVGAVKSTDGGGSWTSIHVPSNFVNAIVIDPDTPAVLYAVTGDGVFKSTDSGGSWTLTGPVAPPAQVVSG